MATRHSWILAKQRTVNSFLFRLGHYESTLVFQWLEDWRQSALKYFGVYFVWTKTSLEAGKELYSWIQYLKELGQDLCDRPLASEKDLETYQRLAIERPATNIISHLQQIEEARRGFNLDGGIIFENHANTLRPVSGS